MRKLLSLFVSLMAFVAYSQTEIKKPKFIGVSASVVANDTLVPMLKDNGTVTKLGVSQLAVPLNTVIKAGSTSSRGFSVVKPLKSGQAGQNGVYLFDFDYNDDVFYLDAYDDDGYHGSLNIQGNSASMYAAKTDFYVAGITCYNGIVTVTSTIAGGELGRGITADYYFPNKIDNDYAQIKDVKKFKTWVAKLSQTGTDAPSETVLDTDFGEITLERVATGVYNLLSTDTEFIPAKTIVIMGTPSGQGNSFIIDNTNAARITLTTFDASLNESDDLLSDTAIEIRTYP